MKFPPKTDAQLADEAMLPEGEYDFTVDKAEDKISKKGREAGATESDMIQVDLTIFSDRGDRKIKDWLMEKMAWKLKHFAFSVGLGAAYESGDLDASSLVGRSGKVMLKKGVKNGDFAPRNEVRDYVVPAAGDAPAEKPKPRVPAAASDDSVPF